jgi:CDP-paratose synthetase
MRLVITGATGFLGSHLARHFLDKGHEVVGFKRTTSSPERLRGASPPPLLLDVDALGPREALHRAGKIDAVIHAACVYGRNGESASQILESNVVLGVRMYEAAAELNVSRFLNVGTGLPSDVSAYSLSKHQFSEWGRRFALTTATRFINFVVEHFYGPNDDRSKFPSHVIAACLRGEKRLALSPGEQQRDFIYVSDVVSALESVLLSAGNDPAVDYPVGTGQAVTIREFAETVRELTGASTHLDFGALPYRPSEPMRCVADISSLKTLGWRPRISLRDGLRRTIEEERRR